ncbi:MAG: NAD(P)H-hydrate dehydratase [Acidobacteria bacterium]|nr:NAD(P)H-hydrate dehydratase [Acidobacteriota bacterium]
MKILTASQMQQVDRLTTEQFGVLGLTLMETAGSSATIAIINQFSTLKYVQIFCGKGNNGGDGAVIARHLWLKGIKVDLFLIGKLEETKGDAYINFAAIKNLAAVETTSLTYQEIESLSDLYKTLQKPCDLYVDALFGTGASRPLAGIYQELVELLNRSTTPIVAIDIPSGLNADSSQIIGTTIKAALTTTMTAPKLANVLPPAMHYNGNLVVIPIGSPDSLVNSCGSQLNLVEQKDIIKFLAISRRNSNYFKNNVGHVLVVAGGQGKIGAAGLTSQAVLRAGAGLVTLASPKSCQQALSSNIGLEIMTESLSENTKGLISNDALKTILDLANNKSLIAIGPGLGTSEDSAKLMLELIKNRPCPLVIDADGLNSLSPWPIGLEATEEKPIIITPHPGEMARLLGVKTSDVNHNRLDLVRKLATDYKLIVVLKGERSLIAAPNGEVYINTTGNAGMATAGSGDVLTGIIAGLLAQAPNEALLATITGVYLHGLAGDLAVNLVGQRSLIASDLTNHLAQAIIQVGGEIEKRNISNSLS